MSKVYSFLDVTASIAGPGGVVSLKGDDDNGVSAEGIVVDPTGDKNVMTVGADGGVMHSLLGDKSGTVTITLLRVNPANAQLWALYNYQTRSSKYHGQNVIMIRDTSRGDIVTCRELAFSKRPSKGFAQEGGTLVWTFHAGKIDGQDGAGE